MKCMYQYGKGEIVGKKHAWILVKNEITGRLSYHLDKYVRVKLKTE